MTLFQRLEYFFRREPPPVKAPKTHDYTKRYWGHDYAILRVENEGEILRMMGWGYGLEAGDYLILSNGGDTTRYRIQTVEYKSNPRDMWSITAVFAPRETKETP